jgi:hypothetical protein
MMEISFFPSISMWADISPALTSFMVFTTCLTDADSLRDRIHMKKPPSTIRQMVIIHIIF